MYQGTVSFKRIPPAITAVMPFRVPEDPAIVFPETGFVPPMNILETAEDYLLLIGAPGLYGEDFSLTIEDGIITITANREENLLKAFGRTKDRCEYDYSEWTRSFELPADADAIRTHAKYKNGELYIHIPRGLPGENQASSEVYVY